MSKKPLSADEAARLHSSPYVIGVKGSRISFTPEFKRMAYERLIAGTSMRQFFEGHVIDPEILGIVRIWGFTQKLREQAGRQEGFEDLCEATMRDNNLLKISTMCEIAGVSRSGYYRWCDGEDADRRDFDLILEAYQYRSYAKGARGIHMRLLHEPGIIMNVKKIRRLMHKYGLRCPIRKANPYRQMAMALPVYKKNPSRGSAPDPEV